jgi:hypothetical protein
VAYAEYLEGKYGPGALDAAGAHLRGAAAADGLSLLDLHELERRPSTFLAHRLLAGALEEGEDEDGELVQQPLQQRLGLGLLSVMGENPPDSLLVPAWGEVALLHFLLLRRR